MIRRPPSTSRGPSHRSRGHRPVSRDGSRAAGVTADARIRLTAGGSGGLLEGFNALSAQVNAPRPTILHDGHTLDVRLPLALGAMFRVTDMMPELATLAAVFALGHPPSLLSRNREIVGPVAFAKRGRGMHPGKAALSYHNITQKGKPTAAGLARSAHGIREGPYDGGNGSG